MIYFAQRLSDNAIKIGTTKNIKHRLPLVRWQQKQPVNLLGIMPGDHKEEKALHRQFNHLALGEEWFTPAPDLLEFIKSNTALTLEPPPAGKKAYGGNIEQHYTIRQVSEVTGLTTGKIRHRINSGKILAVTVPDSKIVRIPASALAAMGFSVKDDNGGQDDD